MESFRTSHEGGSGTSSLLHKHVQLPFCVVRAPGLPGMSMRRFWCVLHHKERSYTVHVCTPYMYAHHVLRSPAPPALRKVSSSPPPNYHGTLGKLPRAALGSCTTLSSGTAMGPPLIGKMVPCALSMEHENALTHASIADTILAKLAIKHAFGGYP